MPTRETAKPSKQPGFDLTDIPEIFWDCAWDYLSPRDRVRALADAPKTFWLFGAGASHHYDLNTSSVGVPLANGFFNAFHRVPTSRGFNAHIGPLISYLNEYRGIRPDLVATWTENIETFMTSLERELLAIKHKKGKRSSADQGKVFSLATAINNMTFILASVINEVQNGPTESLYRYLLDFCGPNDTFATFNWDTLLDRALAATGGWSPNEGYGLSFAATMDGDWRNRALGNAAFTTNWRLLKLHGSTNWLVPYTYISFQTLEFLKTVPKSDKIFLYWQSTLPFKTHRSRWRGGYAPTCYGYYPPTIPGKFFPKQHLAPKPGHVFLSVTPINIFSPFKEPYANGAPASPLLITPVRQKRYEDYTTSMEELWQQATSELKTVSRIVVIGYSFPATDVRAMRMLRNALSKRKGVIELEIVAPDADQIAARIGEPHLKNARRVSIYTGTFEDYIGLLMKTAPARMLRAAMKNTDIQNWVKMIYMMNVRGMKPPKT